jgi:hypothetical protein
VAIEGHKGQRWRVFQRLARLKINALPCVKAPGTDSDGGRTKSNQSRITLQGSAAPDVSPLNAQCLNHFINHPQIMFICDKIGKAAVKQGVKLFRSG